MATRGPTVNSFNALMGLTYRLMLAYLGMLKMGLYLGQIRARDLVYNILGFVLPYRPVGKVIPAGRPGHAGLWPQFVPPMPSDSRSPCPGLNALANHGIIPRNGRRITYKMMTESIIHAYNFAPTLAEVLTDSAWWFENGRGYIDLSDLNAQNVIQHDASFTRPDNIFYPTQGKPHHGLIDQLLDRATGKCTNLIQRVTVPALTLSDMAYQSGIRRYECSKTNGQYKMNFNRRFFGDGNAAFMVTTFGGDTEDLRIWLKEERFPDGWEPRCRYSFGHPMMPGELAALKIEFCTDEKQALRRGDAYVIDQLTNEQGFFPDNSDKSGSASVPYTNGYRERESFSRASAREKVR